MKIPQVMLIEVEHSPGSLARVLAKVGEAGLTVEGLNALHRSQDKTTWELTVELDEQEQIDLPTGVNACVVGISDRVCDHHDGGKIRTLSGIAFEDLQVLKEIEPHLALEKGARFAADGKNINNVLAFPGLFRGALDAGTTCFTDAMLLAAYQIVAEG